MIYLNEESDFKYISKLNFFNQTTLKMEIAF